MIFKVLSDANHFMIPQYCTKEIKIACSMFQVLFQILKKIDPKIQDWSWIMPWWYSSPGWNAHIFFIVSKGSMSVKWFLFAQEAFIYIFISYLPFQ